ncbi:hypothetical protein MLD38_031237 [Melastoma candidum]|uniref:Uncharacterized protein n=1 Tax=Melastoma candidum TaxID=119954 RepID=A0ACB9MNF9_9MYRT|nr:hypothetical protein MLD38_031237 [Melastoma candidum]
MPPTQVPLHHHAPASALPPSSDTLHSTEFLNLTQKETRGCIRDKGINGNALTQLGKSKYHHQGHSCGAHCNYDIHEINQSKDSQVYHASESEVLTVEASFL